MPRFGKFYPQSKWVIGSLALGLSAISGSTIADSGTAPDKQSKQQDAAGNIEVITVYGQKIERTLKETGLGKVKVSGLPHCDWVLLDAGDVIVHLFRPEVRAFYNIEKIWSVDSGHRVDARA